MPLPVKRPGSTHNSFMWASAAVGQDANTGFFWPRVLLLFFSRGQRLPPQNLSFKSSHQPHHTGRAQLQHCTHMNLQLGRVLDLTLEDAFPVPA